MKHRHVAHQNEFGGSVTADFRLLVETTTDGERITREQAQRQADKAAADQQQPPLFPTDS